jgi:hypothetical protein
MSKPLLNLQNKSLKWYLGAAFVAVGTVSGLSYLNRMKQVGDKMLIEQKLVNFDLVALKITLNIKLINQVEQTVSINYPITTLFHGETLIASSLKKDQVITIPALGNTSFNLDFFISLASLGTAAVGIFNAWRKGDAVGIKAVTVSRLRTVSGLLNLPIEKIDIIPVFAKKTETTNPGTTPNNGGSIWSKIRDRIGF